MPLAIKYIGILEEHVLMYTAHKTIFESSGEYFAGSGLYPEVACAQVRNRRKSERGSHQSAHALTV